MAQGINHVAVVGAGYAGLAAAVELAARSIPVTVFERSHTLGGRARRIDRHGVALDNGQHILVGAYGETLRLLRRVGVDPAAALLRIPLTVHYPGRLRLRAPRLPAPMHLLWAVVAATGIGGGEKLAAMQFINCLKAAKFELGCDMSVAALLDDQGQSGSLRRLLWEPLCVASLNTPPERASARVFLHVLRDTLGASRPASDLLLPRQDLTTLFPAAAATFLRANGGEIRASTPVQRIAVLRPGFRINELDDRVFSHLVIAVAPCQVGRLLKPMAELQPVCRTVDAFAYEPIVTCYLACDADLRLPATMIGLSGGLVQWLFDRGRLGGPPGLLAAVISASGPQQAMSHAALAAAVREEVQAALQRPIQPKWIQVIEEKRATFACTPDLQRPQSATPIPRLFIAGDYVASDYPATLESAVRSGVRCAELVIEDLAGTA